MIIGPAVDPQPSAVKCAGCGRTISLRRTGAPGVVGTLHKHALPGGGACPNGGKLPGPRNPKRRCYYCHNTVATHTNGLLYRHRGNSDPNARNPLHRWCEGAGKPGYDETDNTTHGGTAFGLPAYYPRQMFTSDQNQNEAATPRHRHKLSPGEELAKWWRGRSEEQIDGLVAKAVDYGATDLRDLGLQMLELANRRDSATDAYATEVGIAFYAWGKLARIMAAVKEGRYPNPDSWYDLEIYAKMAQRVQSHGGWPGIPHAADLYIEDDEEA